MVWIGAIQKVEPLKASEEGSPLSTKLTAYLYPQSFYPSITGRADTSYKCTEKYKKTVYSPSPHKEGAVGTSMKDHIHGDIYVLSATISSYA